MKQSLKQILSLSLALVILCTLLPVSVLAAAPTSGQCGDNAYWEYDATTKTLTISGTGDMWDYDTVISGQQPWFDCGFITAIIIKEGITGIGDGAFMIHGQLKTVSIPEGLKTVGDNAFYSCESLESVIFPDSVTIIGDSAFEYCFGLENVKFSKNLTSIGEGAFFWCSNLTTLEFPDGLTSIGHSAFFNCEGLTNITIPNSVSIIAPYAFDGCESLSEVYYTGSKAQWLEIDIEGGNEPLAKAHITYGKESENDSDSAFRDVKASDWFYNSVMWAVENGITGGTGHGTFSPNDSCTRAQVVTFLWAAAGKPEPASTSTPFKDVKSYDWYYDAVLWAVEQGITGGLTADTFGPNNTCTRAQIVTFLYAAEGKPYVGGTSNFSDVSDSAWFAKAVKWAAKYDVTGGIGNGMFGPNNTCTRGQVVTFLYKADQVDPSGYEESPLKLYIPAVEAALAENPAFGDLGSGFLFDIDDDGLEEMVLLWETKDFEGNSYYPWGFVYSVYDIENGNLVTKADRDFLVYNEETPYAYVQIAKYQGQKVLVACRGGLGYYSSSRYEYTLYDTVTFEKILTSESNYAGPSLIRAEFINNDDSDGSMRLYQLLAHLQQSCGITAEQTAKLTQSDAERIAYNEWSDYLSSSTVVQYPAIIKDGVKYYCYSRQSNSDFDYYKVRGYLFINSVTGEISITLFLL